MPSTARLRHGPVVEACSRSPLVVWTGPSRLDERGRDSGRVCRAENISDTKRKDRKCGYISFARGFLTVAIDVRHSLLLSSQERGTHAHEHNPENEALRLQYGTTFRTRPGLKRVC